MIGRLPPEEPPANGLRTVSIAQFADELAAHVGAPDGRLAVVAVDGRSGSGKTTIARRLVSSMDDAAVVSTDDLAWHHSFFGWADLLIDGVLRPFRHGAGVAFVPPGWRQRERPGAVEVPASTRLLIVEGVGASRHEAAPLVDAAIWVQSDADEARRRCLARHGADAGASAFWQEWMDEEGPFLAGQRPWERADVIVVNDDLAGGIGDALRVTRWAPSSARAGPEP